MAEDKEKMLVEIFQRMRQKISKYAPPFEIRIDEERRYELWSVKELVIEGRKRKEVFFAALIIQKDYVGFYFMPVYAEAELAQVFGADLRKRLKGKSCFHVKKLDEGLLGQIESALEIGYQLYRERGWV